ncbi:hypothetical protein C5C18_05615 [Rathayibacter tritici]|uniref:GntT/GntP/DsdX family permease n=1 Tax=Rathayibacter tritici TaxID=33888 RepID=UPI000CE7DB15|nr:hypothetical protein [Rathayibacter tritici]PPF27605.1 hypothetical protein C5C06_09275 [Rathayibacter tritici]PPF68115.1 hypothetical protein C5C21_05355 [Rathayibacter tritici]PPG08002.1 hypothetical protein C5C18_05615 [Rathayibacter tritici]PPI20034.1 hypothetical protein C5D07_00110 [Rathayibacter tritici]
MPEWYTLGVVALAIVVVVVSIVRFRFNPVLALAVGAAAIGLLTGLGPVDTVSTMTTGFGESFLGQSVRGALTSVTVGVSLASVLAPSSANPLARCHLGTRHAGRGVLKWHLAKATQPTCDGNMTPLSS